MKQAAFILLGAPLVLLLSGCPLSAKQPKVAKAIPAPPTVTPVQPAAPPQGPLSLPQTEVQLPAPQPLSEEAIATTRPPEEPVESQPAPRTPPRRSAVAGPPRVEPTVPAQVQTPPGLPPPEAPERPPIAEILPEPERKRLQESADAHKLYIKKVLDQTNSRKLSSAQRELVARIRTLVQQSDDAGTRNDWRQADALAGQAQVLVRELQGGR